MRWILRLGEITLKSRPVRRFMRKSLQRHLHAQAKVRGCEINIEPYQGLLMAKLTSGEVESAEDAFRHTFGLVAADRYLELPLDPAAVAEEAVKSYSGESTFAVRCRRHGDKQEWNSQTFAGHTGAEVLERIPELKVNLGDPEWAVTVSIMPDKACLIQERIPCAGGLPTGVQGTVFSHLRTENETFGAFMVMRRGCRILCGDNPEPSAMEMLKRWDPYHIDKEYTESLRTAPGPGHIGKIWAVVGESADVEADPEVPLANLDPLVGMSPEEVEEVRAAAGL